MTSNNDDLASLKMTQLDTILSCLISRHETGRSSTRIGSDILVSVQPKSDFDIQESSYYASIAEQRWSSPETAETVCPSHLLDLASTAFYEMLYSQVDISIILRGNSGSGKSNAKSLIVQQLASLSRNAKKNSKVVSGAIKLQTVLSSFGNASLPSNPHSTRFGLYSEFQYSKSGRMVGIKTLDYLLDKNRITSGHSADGGRNFNIFYQLLAGLSSTERESFFLPSDSPNSYMYLNGKESSGFGGTLGRKKSIKSETLGRSRRGTITKHSIAQSGITPQDAQQFTLLCEHLKSLGMGKNIQLYIFQVMAAILHLGNIIFVDDPLKPSEPCTIKNLDTVSHASQLLGISESALISTLTCQTRLIGKEFCSMNLPALEARKRKDDLSRALYSLVFSWIIGKLNDRLCKEESLVDNFISILDFPSLSSSIDNECFGFYEYCSNLAYERIAQFTDSKLLTSRDLIFKSELENAPRIPFVDHSSILQLLVGSSSITATLNEETMAKQSAESISGTLNSKFSRNEVYIPSSRCASNAVSGSMNFIFGIRHHSSRVEYALEDFGERNTETISSDFVALFKSSKDSVSQRIECLSDFMSNLFSMKMGIETTETKGGLIVSARINNTLKRNPSLKRKGGAGSKKAMTIKDSALANLLDSLDDLMMSISSTKMYSVLCLNPIQDKRVSVGFLRDQAEELSISALVQTRCYTDVQVPGMDLTEFESQYLPSLSKLVDVSGGVTKALDTVSSLWGSRHIQIGRTQVFLSEGKWRLLKSMNQDDFQFQENQSVFSDSVASFASESPFHNRQASQESRLAFTEEEYDSETVNYEKQKALQDQDKGFTVSNTSVKKKEIVDSVKKVTPARKWWSCITWSLTWWALPPYASCCIKRPDVRMAWREKLALCIIIFFCNAMLLFLIIGLRYIICPPKNIRTLAEVQTMSEGGRKPWVAVQGRYYYIGGMVEKHVNVLGRLPLGPSDSNIQDEFQSFALGKDTSGFFFKQDSWGLYCSDLPRPPPDWDYLDSSASKLAGSDTNFMTRPTNSRLLHRLNDTKGNSVPFIEGIRPYVSGKVGWSLATIKSISNPSNVFIIIYNNVYYVSTVRTTPDTFNTQLFQLLTSSASEGKDISEQFTNLRAENPAYYNKALKCMNEMFYVGTVDDRDTLACRFSNGMLLAASVILCSVIVFKFLAALRCTSTKTPDEHDKFVVLMVPCYTEGADSLAKSFESLAAMDYDDKRKLLFVVCDGMIVGAGNDKPTPRIVLDILGVDPNIDPEPLSFQSLGEGNKQHNMGKVYSGLYEIRGHSVPFIVVVKVGGTGERIRPGNRGKRDSQLVLMRFFNRVHFNTGMSPLELELYYQMKNVIGVNPSFYEFVLMVDADTEVEQNALNGLISVMVNDSKIMGLCGETQIANEKDTWVTMIQVYEYFISHHLSKAFESLFNTVTCLPGCFCLYRIRSAAKNTPLLVSNGVLQDYSENSVDTLHLKNLLHLGEDRYLTTLMLKHFPNMRTCFTNDAKCKTSAPERWKVLLSQRRRWINSTVHNLFELVWLEQLCGFCCFSMRFIVLIDLIATFIQPATVLYVFYLIYAVAAEKENFPILSIILIAAVYGLQVIIFLIKREWQHIFWMLIYIIAMPIFSFWIPCYSFWHFDDFSWGNTRVVVGEGKKMVLISDAEPFDPKSIPIKSWKEHEDIMENWDQSTMITSTSYQSGKPLKDPNTSNNPNMNVPSYTPSVVGSEKSIESYSRLSNNPNRMSMMSHFSGVHTRPSYAQNQTPTASPRLGGVRTSTLPSDDVLRLEIRNILAVSDLMTLTKKQVRESLGAKFGVDLKPKRDVINGLIDSILKEM